MADQPHRQGRDHLADVRSAVAETGRVNQKLRTRQALIDAARQLIAAGANPTLAEVAEHALVSKTTAYRYYASADALIADAFFDDGFPTVDDTLGAVGDDLTSRVLAVEGAVNDALLAQERAMRVIIRNALEISLASDDAAPRVGRRQSLIAAALEPLESVHDRDTVERLRHALALVIGPEAIIAARDVCALSPVEAREVTRWAAEALVARALAELDV